MRPDTPSTPDSPLCYAHLIGGPCDGTVLALPRMPRAISRPGLVATQTYYRIGDRHYHTSVYAYYANRTKSK